MIISTMPVREILGTSHTGAGVYSWHVVLTSSYSRLYAHPSPSSFDPSHLAWRPFTTRPQLPLSHLTSLMTSNLGADRRRATAILPNKL